MSKNQEIPINPNEKPWSIKANGFKVGHFKHLQQQSFIYPNGSQLVRVYLKGNRTTLDRCFLKTNQDGSIEEVQRVLFDFGVFNELRFYDPPNIARKEQGKTYYFTPIEKFIKVLPRNKDPIDDRLFFTYDYLQKQWFLKWGKPKPNRKIQLFGDGTYKKIPKPQQRQNQATWIRRTPTNIKPQ